MHWDLTDEAATVAAGQKFGTAVGDGAIVYLDGQLGAGKTTFCRGVLSAFGYSGAVKSPTYTLVEPYELKGITAYHFDLYRLGDPEELEYMGIRDYFTENAICLIEWPERGAGVLPLADIQVSIVQHGSGRRLTLVANTARGRQIVCDLSGRQH
ncbi:tRNA (adenosine(37)-N6)-threonylcarbamoyltransferase complex ATPase subunit type 1 TsaE [Spongiibacter sp. KMU-158]|uniref:tRNA threonylcarbamoyladenosine biosynthesis protein TsaE n=1 Tax=Spongiibacter pelagi TaxID=2760804 RepID=A0A927C0Q5_9GAMM|nr:tRNA (adenosine(37)-N6)-threonylcarbamoyltransferase complex ATPase subunit type 1 TsaE [Spongiibacter pelagi]